MLASSFFRYRYVYYRTNILDKDYLLTYLLTYLLE